MEQIHDRSRSVFLIFWFSDGKCLILVTSWFLYGQTDISESRDSGRKMWIFGRIFLAVRNVRVCHQFGYIGSKWVKSVFLYQFSVHFGSRCHVVTIYPSLRPPLTCLPVRTSFVSEQIIMCCLIYTRVDHLCVIINIFKRSFYQRNQERVIDKIEEIRHFQIPLESKDINCFAWASYVIFVLPGLWFVS